jgi:hypothetical protein
VRFCFIIVRFCLVVVGFCLIVVGDLLGRVEAGRGLHLGIVTGNPWDFAGFGCVEPNFPYILQFFLSIAGGVARPFLN